MSGQEFWKIGDTILDRYRIVKVLGFGGMGSVYAAKDLARGELDVALKVLPKAQKKYLQKFRQEFSILANSQHPNVLRVFDFHIDPKADLPFYTSEFLAGQTLQEEKETWKDPDLIDLLVQMSRALNFLHARGITHGDIKPSNIIRRKGGPFVLLDFGVSRLKGKYDWQDIGGTPSFMAPEIRMGKLPDHRADLFSLGLTVFRCATGENPFAKAWKSRRSKVDPLKLRITEYRNDLSETLRETIEKLISWEPDERFQEGAQILRKIHQANPEEFPLETKETLLAYLNSPHLVGREDALREAIEISGLQENENSTPNVQVLVVHGPKGMGKTRFADEVRRRFQLEGIPVHQMDDSEDFYVNDYTTQGSGWLVDDADLLSMEDLLAMSHFIRERISEHPRNLFVLMVERPSALAHLRVPLRKIELRPLSTEDIREYLSAIPYSFHPRFIETLHEKSKGLPFLLLSLLKSLLSKIDDLGKVESAEHLQNVKLDRVVGDAFHSSLEKLSEGARRTLALISLSQNPLPFSTLLEVLKKEKYGSFAHLKELLVQQFVRSNEEDGKVFLHVTNPALSAVLSSTLTKKRSEHAHRLILQVLSTQEKEQEKNNPQTLRALVFHAIHARRSSETVSYLKPLGRALLNNQKNADAANVFDQSLPFLLEQGERKRLGEILLLASHAYFRVGRLEDSVKMIKAMPKSSASDWAMYYRRLAEVALRQRKLQQAKRIFKDVEKAIQNLPAPDKKKERIRLLSIREIHALHNGNWKDLSKFAQRIESAPAKVFWKERILSQCIRGHAARTNGDISEAIKLYSQALNESIKHRYPGGRAMALGSLALCQQVLDENMDALESFDRAIDAAEEAYDILNVATHSLNQGRLQEEIGEYRAALTSFERSMELYERCKNWGSYAHALYRKTQLRYFLEGQLDEESMVKAQELARLHDHRSIALFCKLAIAKNTSAKNKRERLLEDVENGFSEGQDPSALLEIELIRYEYGEPKEELPWHQLSTSQKVRYLEAGSLEPQAFLTPSFQKLIGESFLNAEKSSNREWKMRLLHLKAREAAAHGRRSEAKKSAQQAKLLLLKLSSQFEGELQTGYLKSRGLNELETHLEDTVVHGRPAPYASEGFPSLAYAGQNSASLLGVLRNVQEAKSLEQKLEGALDGLKKHLQCSFGLVAIQAEEKADVLLSKGIEESEIDGVLQSAQPLDSYGSITDSEGPTVSRLTGFRMKSSPHTKPVSIPLQTADNEWFLIFGGFSSGQTLQNLQSAEYALFFSALRTELARSIAETLHFMKQNELDRLQTIKALDDQRKSKMNISEIDLEKRSFDLLDELDKIAKKVVQAKLQRNSGNKSKTARDLGLSRSGLLKMIDRLGIAS